MADDDSDVKNVRLHSDQPYDESLDIPDSEEVASIYTPTPRVAPRYTSQQDRGRSRGDTPPEHKMSDQSDDEFDSGGMAPLGEPGAGRGPGGGGLGPVGGKGPGGGGQMYGGDDDDDEEDGSTESDEDDDDDGSNGAIEGKFKRKSQKLLAEAFEHNRDETLDSTDFEPMKDLGLVSDEDDVIDEDPPPKGNPLLRLSSPDDKIMMSRFDSELFIDRPQTAYDPSDYENLPVTPEIKELFQYITRYTPQSIDLDHKLKPFIPDFIPAVGDIDAFIKITRPDNKPDNLGLNVLDEPCAKQSDPTVLDLQLRSISKQTNLKAVVVKSIESAEKNPRAVDNWIQSISEIHRTRPPPNVHYTKNMPNIDDLMQEWPENFEELLKEVSLPTAEIDCDLSTYIDMICALLDIPIYKSKIQSLHVLFTLYSEFKNSQHFQRLANKRPTPTTPSADIFTK